MINFIKYLLIVDNGKVWPKIHFLKFLKILKKQWWLILICWEKHTNPNKILGKLDEHQVSTQLQYCVTPVKRHKKQNKNTIMPLGDQALIELTDASSHCLFQREKSPAVPWGECIHSAVMCNIQKILLRGSNYNVLEYLCHPVELRKRKSLGGVLQG